MWSGRDGGDRGSRRRERSPAIVTILAELSGFQHKVKASASEGHLLFEKLLWGCWAPDSSISSQNRSRAFHHEVHTVWPSKSQVYLGGYQTKQSYMSRWPNSHISNLYHTADSPSTRFIVQWGILWDSLNFIPGRLAGLSPRSSEWHHNTSVDLFTFFPSLLHSWLQSPGCVWGLAYAEIMPSERLWTKDNFISSRYLSINSSLAWAHQ